MLYSSVIRGDGDVATYLDLATENRRVACESDDLAAQINASTYLADALELSGRFSEVLQIVEPEIARAPRHLAREEWAWGFNPHPLLRAFRAMALTCVGRLREGLEEWGRVSRMSEEDGAPELTAWALCFTARAHYLAADADRALACARQADATSRAQAENVGLAGYVRVAAAHAFLAGGRAVDATESARSALDLLRHADKSRAGEAATTLAVALLEAGDLAAAESAAGEAIALCRRSLRAIHEAVAHGVLARALLRRDGTAARAGAEAALADAAALIERTGGKTFAPALCEWRAELAAVLGQDVRRVQLLRDAQQRYEEIGAPGHVERLRTELGS